MAATIPYSGYGSLIWKPKDSLANPSKDDLTKMRFDNMHYTRAYNQCRGRGVTAAICAAALPGDAHVTPHNPMAIHFTKEVVDGIECMSDTGDVAKCQHYFEGTYKKVHPVPKKIGRFEGTINTLSLAGTTGLGIASAAGLLMLQGLRLRF